MARINWKEEFDKADQENTERYQKLKLEQMRKLFIGLILNCDNEKAMRSSLIFHATKENLRLVDCIGGFELQKREGGADNE